MTLSTANRKKKKKLMVHCRKKHAQAHSRLIHSLYLITHYTYSVPCTEQISELYKLLAQQDNLLVPGYQMGYLSSLKLSINLQ